MQSAKQKFKVYVYVLAYFDSFYDLLQMLQLPTIVPLCG